MNFSKFATLVLIQTFLCSYSNCSQYDEGCHVEERVALQVAFVVDGTGTFFFKPRPWIYSFMERFEMLAPTLLNEIDKDYPGAQFALTTHHDWNWEAGTKRSDNEHEFPDKCYVKYLSFTTNKTLFQDKIGDIERIVSGEQENGLSALAFTATDATLGWNRNSTTSDGKVVRRVLILVTDEDDVLNLENPGNRHEFRGDGTDTCETSKPPSYDKLREIFQKYQMTIIALLFLNRRRPGLDKLYRQHFNKISNSVPFCLRTFIGFRSGEIRPFVSDRDLKNNWEKDLVDLDELAYFNKNQYSTKPMKLNLREKEDYTEQEDNESDQPIGSKAVDNIQFIENIQQCLGETKGCLFGDPEGFNTLGL